MPIKTFTVPPGPEQLRAGPSGTTTTQSLYTGDTYATNVAASTNNEQGDLLWFGFVAKSTDTASTFLNFDTSEVPPGSIITAATVNFVSNQTDTLATGTIDSKILGLAPGLYSSEVTDLVDNTLAMNCSLGTIGLGLPDIDYTFDNTLDSWSAYSWNSLPAPILSTNATHMTITEDGWPGTDPSGNIAIVRTSVGLTSAETKTKILIRYRLTSLGLANSWVGWFLFKRTTDANVSSARRFDLAEPAVGVWNEVVIDASVNANWNGTVDEFEFRLGQSVTNQGRGFVVDIDSIKIGDPSSSFTDVTSAQGGSLATFGINCYDGSSSHYQAMRVVGTADSTLDSVTIRLRRNGVDVAKTAWVEVWSVASESPGNYKPGSLLATSNHVPWNDLPSPAADYQFFFSNDQRIDWTVSGPTLMVRFNQSFTPYKTYSAWVGYFVTTYWGSSGPGYPTTSSITTPLTNIPEGSSDVFFSTPLGVSYGGSLGFGVPDGTETQFVVGERMRLGPTVTPGGVRDGEFWESEIASVTGPVGFPVVTGYAPFLGYFCYSSTILSALLPPTVQTLLPVLGVVATPGESGLAFVDNELVRFDRLSATEVQVTERAVGDTELANHLIGAPFRVDFPAAYNGLRDGTFTGFTKNIYPYGQQLNELNTITTESAFTAPLLTDGNSYSWGSSSLSPDFVTDHVVNAVQAVVNHSDYTGQLGIKVEGVDDGSTTSFARYKVWRSSTNPSGPGPSLTVEWLDKGKLDSGISSLAVLGGLLSGSNVTDSDISCGSVMDGVVKL